MKTKALFLKITLMAIICGSILYPFLSFQNQPELPRSSHKPLVDIQEKKTVNIIKPPASILEPDKVAYSFIEAYHKKPPHNTENKTIQSQRPPIIAANEWLKPLGRIRDDKNTEWLYIKNEKTNSVIKMRTDGIEEKGLRMINFSTSQYVVSVDGIMYTISGDKK